MNFAEKGNFWIKYTFGPILCLNNILSLLQLTKHRNYFCIPLTYFINFFTMFLTEPMTIWKQFIFLRWNFKLNRAQKKINFLS